MSEASVETKRCNVAIIVAGLHAGGTERVASTIANHLSKGGESPLVVLINFGRGVFYPLDAGIRIERLAYCKHESGLAIAYDFFSTIFRLRRLLAKYRVQRQMSFLPHVNLISLFAAIGSGRRVILSERNDMANQVLSRKWRVLRVLVYRFADLVIVNLKKNEQSLAKFVPPSRVRWLPNPLILTKFFEIEPTASKKIIAVGRLSAQKAFDDLIRAYSLSQSRQHGWTLKIIGEGEERHSLSRLISDLNLSTWITIEGVTSDISSEFASAEIIVMSSRYEGMPNVLIEGMAAGLVPVVTQGVGDLAGILATVSDKIVLPINSPTKLAKALDDLIKDDSERLRIGKRVRELARPYEASSAMKLWTQMLYE